MQSGVKASESAHDTRAKASTTATVEKAASLVLVSRRLSSQSSVSDDLELTSSGDAQLVQAQLLHIVACCVAMLKQFSPNLPQILLDQVMTPALCSVC